MVGISKIPIIKSLVRLAVFGENQRHDFYVLMIWPEQL